MATHIYWVNNRGGTIGRANLNGSSVNQSFITGADGPFGVALNGTHVYWTNFNGGTIGRANLNGLNVNQSLITGAGSAYGITVGDSKVYWANRTTNAIGRADFNGANANGSFISGADGPVGVVASSTSSLPVELTGFTATASGADALLRWETASEINNTGFDVQIASGSSDTFRSLGWVAGAGTTLEAQRYAFRTDALAPGAYRFRLHQIDLDGASEFSPVVELSIAPKGYALAVAATFSNAADVSLTLERAQTVRVSAYDLLGRQIAVLHDGQVDGSAAWTLSGDLPSGVYFIRAEGESFATTAQTIRVR